MNKGHTYISTVMPAKAEIQRRASARHKIIPLPLREGLGAGFAVALITAALAFMDEGSNE